MKGHHSLPGKDQRGLSLIELMVGLTVGLVISLGLFALVAGTSSAFKVQDDFARLQENGTTALRYLVDDIRMAGFYGLATDSQSVHLDSAILAAAGIDGISDDCAAGTPSPPWSLNLLQPIDVESGLTQASVHAALPCIQSNDFAAGNASVIILRGASGTAVPAADLDANTLYVQSSPTQDPNTILFRGSKFADLKAAGHTRTFTNGDDFPIFEYQTHVYYLRPCSRPAPPATTCSNLLNDDGGRSIPTLVRHQLVGSTLQLVPLVEGIERINLLYGIDSNNDGVVEQFTATPADWSQVVAVRVFVLVRTTTATTGYSDANKSYDLGGGVTFACTPNVDCNFRRHVFSQLASMRNCAQRRGGNKAC